MTVSMPGDGWMNLGWLGLIITIGAVAWFLGAMHRKFWQNIQNPRVVMAYVTFLPISIQWFRDGGVLITKFWLFTLAPILLWIGFSKLFDRLAKMNFNARLNVPPRR
jgi:hypothetical protein